VNSDLAPVRFVGGIYCVAWSSEPPLIVNPTDVAVRYIGETSEFLRRIGQFGDSAGFCGARRNGHSAAWRWPVGQTANTWISFFPIGSELLPHLADGMRSWMEAVALEEFRLAHGRLPDVNEATSEIDHFET